MCSSSYEPHLREIARLGFPTLSVQHDLGDIKRSYRIAVRVSFGDTGVVIARADHASGLRGSRLSGRSTVPHHLAIVFAALLLTVRHVASTTYSQIWWRMSASATVRRAAATLGKSLRARSIHASAKTLKADAHAVHHAEDVSIGKEMMRREIHLAGSIHLTKFTNCTGDFTETWLCIFVTPQVHDINFFSSL